MALYAISDLHLSLNGSKPMTIFSGWENYVEKLEKNWKQTVSENDTVVICGDITWAMRLQQTYDDFKFINSLPGKKILLKGNHDYWWTSVTKNHNFFKNNNFNTLGIIHNSAVKYENFYLCGTKGYPIKSIEKDEKILNREIGRLSRSIEIAANTNSEAIVFFHYPPATRYSEVKQFIDIMVEKKVKKCYYGHVHGAGFSNNVLTGLYKGIDFHLVSCDFVGFKPVLVLA